VQDSLMLDNLGFLKPMPAIISLLLVSGIGGVIGWVMAEIQIKITKKREKERKTR